MGKFIYICFFLMVLVTLILPMSSYAQNCSQNNLNIQNIEFKDSNGNPFDPNSEEHQEGDMVTGQIFVTFGGSSTNAYNLRILYDVYRNGVMDGDRQEHCLFVKQSVPKGTPQFITDFTLRWGDLIEFRNIFMRWFTNNGNEDCPTEAGSNAQCYSDPDGEVVNTPFIPLPVIWHDLSAEAGSDQTCVEIKWSTLKEWESSHFEIERSVQGIDRFEVIDKIPAATYSFEVKSYQFRDDQLPPNTTRVYYRLKQVDLDGSFEYSKVMMVNVNTNTHEAQSWRAFPNPMLDDKLSVELQNPSAYRGEEIYLRVITSQTSYLHSIPICPGPYNIDLSPITKNIPTGLFLVEISWGDRVETFKIIKR
ncbi:hypothetical protein [Belliella pelovolcani]|uniref:hypothetical protein n=1 Tax=Belliella pelovolcani TaxID=529505 RepID=UPI00391AD5C7